MCISFGLLVIGDEILHGKRRDRHFENLGGLLRKRGYEVKWLRILPDDPEYLVQQLRQSMSERVPVFSCGGIGATPDDYTREAAAKAAGVELIRHPEAVKLIEQRFAEDAYPTRIRMADLPDGSTLIPNSYNQVPGFAINQHYFMPGFPDMALPMATWVMDSFYPSTDQQIQYSLWVKGVTETDLMPLLEGMTQDYPEYKLFSLPRLGEPRRVELGYRGNESIKQPFSELQKRIQAAGFEFELEM